MMSFDKKMETLCKVFQFQSFNYKNKRDKSTEINCNVKNSIFSLDFNKEIPKWKKIMTVQHKL